MTLETPRLLLRPWQEADAEELYRWASDPLVGHAAGWTPHASVEDSLHIIRTLLSQPDTFAVLPRDGEGGPIGSVGVFTTGAPEIADEPEIGYWLARPFWGRGLIPEVVEELLRWQFQERNAERVWCGHFPGNDKSRRVIEKCGFRYVCTGPERPWPDGVSRSSLYYALTRQEWEARHGD